MPFFYVDWYYIVLVLPAVILSLWASAHVKSTFRRYSQVRNARGMTGAEAAMAVLRAHGVTDVRVEHVSGELTDHFDPKDHVIRLSDAVYNVATPAAVGVASASCSSSSPCRRSSTPATAPCAPSRRAPCCCRRSRPRQSVCSQLRP